MQCTNQQFLSKHIRLFMGVLRVNLKFEVRRKAIVVILFLLFKRNSFQFRGGEQSSAIQVGEMIP